MENKEKRTRLGKEQRLEIIKAFVAQQCGKEFTVETFIGYLEGFDWFKKLSDQSKSERALRYIKEMKEYFGDNFKQIRKGAGNRPGKYVVSETEETKPEETKPETYNTEEIRKLYLVVKKVDESRVGVSKKDVAELTGIKLTGNWLDTINTSLENMTGYRPFILVKSEFVNYDILRIADKEVAKLVIQELAEKLDGPEPIMPSFNDFETFIKKVIRNDYITLKMFLPSNTIYYKNGDLVRFRKAILGEKSKVTIGIDRVAEIFQEMLKRRYGIDLSFVGRSRNYVCVMDSENREKTRDALKRIEEVFAEYFCEDIVNRERTIWEQENQKSNEPSSDEKSKLEIIENIIFKGKDGGIYLSELWKKFDKLNIKRGWDLLGLLKKCPEKFKIDTKQHSAGYTEDFILYTAPIKEEPHKEEEQQPQPVIESEENEVMVVEETSKPDNSKFKVITAFSERLDIEFFCGKLEHKDIKKHREDYIIEVEVDKTSKSSVLEFMKLYYASLRSDNRLDVFITSKELIPELESILKS